MKKSIALAVAAVFMGCTAFAGSIADMSWSQLAQDQHFIIEWTQLPFAQAVVPVTNVCVDGNQFRTIQPVSVCIKSDTVKRYDCTINEWADSGETCVELAPGMPAHGQLVEIPGCVQTAMQNLSMPLAHSVTECVMYDTNEFATPDCEQTATHTELYSTSPMINILTQNLNPEAPEYSVVAQKAFTIPACAAQN